MRENGGTIEKIMDWFIFLLLIIYILRHAKPSYQGLYVVKFREENKVSKRQQRYRGVE